MLNSQTNLRWHFFVIVKGVDSQYTVTIVSNPAGTPVSGSTNTFDYPILSSVTLTCVVDPSPPADTTYQWDTGGCFTNGRHTFPTCFPGDKTTQSLTDTDLLAEDAGTIMCTANIDNTGYDSGPFTLRISGIHIMLVVTMWSSIYGYVILVVSVMSCYITLAVSSLITYLKYQKCML